MIASVHPDGLCCKNCRFSKVEHAPPLAIQKVRYCLFGPPQLVAVLSQQGTQIVAMFPQVQDHIVCAQHIIVPMSNPDAPGPFGGGLSIVKT